MSLIRKYHWFTKKTKGLGRFWIQKGIGVWIGVMVVIAVQVGIGCSPEKYHQKMDRTAGKIIEEKQQQSLGRTESFTIERPSDTFRRRLLTGQELATSGGASLGADALERIEHWPEPNSAPKASGDDGPAVEGGKVIRLSLIDSLKIGAKNSPNYQSQKEKVFQAALGLELERNEFRSLFFGQLKSQMDSRPVTKTKTIMVTDPVTHNVTTEVVPDGTETEIKTTQTAKAGGDRKLSNGTQIHADIVGALVCLLTQGGSSTLGMTADGSVSVPLLRGSGKHIVMEPLVQADRDVIYAIWEFEQYKKEFVVGVADQYFSVLRQLDQLKNSADDYRSRITSARRSRRLADAGTLRKIEVDQAVQNELSSRARWISATQRYQQQLDGFKILIGLPPDARIELDPNDIAMLSKSSQTMIERLMQDDEKGPSEPTPHADAPIDLKWPSMANAGPLELEYDKAIGLGLEKRLDFLATQGKVYDSQRAVVVAADALGAELTLFGSATLSDNRPVSSSELEKLRLRTKRGVYSAAATLDLPFERTAEAVNYRQSFIALEQSVRAVQTEEDQIKKSIRDELRNMVETRENVYIQAKAVQLAQNRVKSVNMFLEAGRTGIQIRDLLDAQDALLSAQIQLTAAEVDYRMSELRIQQQMGVLEVDGQGMWQEYSPEQGHEQN